MVFLTFLESRSNEALRFLGIVLWLKKPGTALSFKSFLGFPPTNSVFKSILKKDSSSVLNKYTCVLKKFLFHYFVSNPNVIYSVILQWKTMKTQPGALQMDILQDNIIFQTMKYDDKNFVILWLILFFLWFHKTINFSSWKCVYFYCCRWRHKMCAV